MTVLGSKKGGVDLTSLDGMEFGGALGSKKGRKFAKQNGRKLVVDKEKVKNENMNGLMPRMILVLKSADEY